MPLPKIIRTKIIPPQKSARILARPRVTRALLDALNYRMTILQAGAGYGKSTALTVLGEEFQPLIWYQVTEEDGDPLVFLLHLCHATQIALPGLTDLPLPFLDAWDGNRGPLPSAGVIDQYINALSENLGQPALLVLDDVHLAASAPEIAYILDRLAGLAPPDLHILLAARPPLKLPNLSRWRAQGEVLTLDQSTLAFNVPEILTLFAQHYGYELTGEEAEALMTTTEGWAIAIQLIWQSLRSGPSLSVEESLTRQASSQDSLFEILASEVFEGQPADVQEFLLASATLREMTPEACDALQESSDSGAMLAYLQRQELFVVELGERGEPGGRAASGSRLRYHHIFHRFLRQQASNQQRHRWHGQAAGYYRQRGELDSAIYHLLRADDPEGAAALLDDYGTQLLLTGRLDTLAADLDSLPPEILPHHPALLSYLGDLARLHSRFQEALGWYRQAETIWRERGQVEGVSRALRGQVRVYLDTVDPSGAEELLQRALRLIDGAEDRESRARLYELLAENKLNSGHPEEAERLRQQAETLRAESPSDSQLLIRVLLRTGRLEEARLKLEERAEAERLEPVHVPRAHRETPLLLSLIYAFQGLKREAYQTAMEGTRRGIDLNSPFVTAVGYSRQGHALTLWHDPDHYGQARAHFEKAVEQSHTLSTQRLGVESYWGLCHVYGYQGDLPQALHMAQVGIDLANQAGDEWIAALIRLTVGASFILRALSSSKQDFGPAETWLNRADLGFQECSDPFGWTATRLWLCLAWFHQKDELRLSQALPEILSICRERQYEFLFIRPTLLGPPDERILVPLLILARERGWEAPCAARLLKAAGLPEITMHPGYQLRVYTLGTFQVWRGAQPIPANGWRREKARQLFQLLITNRQASMDREQIVEHLWPGMDPATAQRNFKVTLNTLYHVLEPERDAGGESAYILREGSSYGLRPGADLWLDADIFTSTLRQAEKSLEGQARQVIPIFRQALEFYQGEYLPEARYETWAAAEREHLAVLYLRSADRLSELLLQSGQPQEAIQVCQRILSFDNCWERAYRHLMLAFDMLGDHGQIARSYQRCVQTLREELDVAPAPETDLLYQRLTVNAER